MKKSLVALAVLAAAGAASAQSSVTLFGIVDASISNYSNKSDDRQSTVFPNAFGIPTYLNRGTAKLSQTVLTNSGYNSSRLGFRGTEDLGGGLAASFWLEAPISNDDGQSGISTFQRRSTVSLSGGFGEVRLGRDYTATFWNDTSFDPFGTNGVGTNLIYRAGAAQSAFGPATVAPGGTAFAPGAIISTPGVPNVTGNNYVRASNMVAYFLPPNLGGFYGQVQYGFSEKVNYGSGTLVPAGTDTRAGRFVGGRFGYANGPLDVALAASEGTMNSDFNTGFTNKEDVVNLGASYDFGPAKLFGEVSKMKNKMDYAITPFPGTVRLTTAGTPGSTNDIDTTGYMIGVTVPVGPGLIRFSYAGVKYDYNAPTSLFGNNADPKSNQLALGYVHNLSKRTALYATIARISNKNGANNTVGGPAYALAGPFIKDTSTGYDFGIRHAF
jgi:predicted porin